MLRKHKLMHIHMCLQKHNSRPTLLAMFEKHKLMHIHMYLHKHNSRPTLLAMFETILVMILIVHDKNIAFPIKVNIFPIVKHTIGKLFLLYLIIS